MGQKQLTDDTLHITTRYVELQPGLIVSLTSANEQDNIATKVCYQHDSAYIHFNCLLRGRFEATVRDRDIALSPGDLNVGYAQHEHFSAEHSGDLSTIELMVDSGLLTELAGEDCLLFQGHAADAFFTRTCRAGSRVKAAAAQLLHHLSQTPCPQLLLHSATLDFLHWHLDAFKGECCEQQIGLRDRRKLQEARDYLLLDLSTPPTIADIARKVGLNQCKLKQGFKQVFDSSIYAYFQGERMKQAQLLLQRYNVTETAMILGYSNVSHFSSAFRKQFGMLPSNARQHLAACIAGAPA